MNIGTWAQSPTAVLLLGLSRFSFSRGSWHARVWRAVSVGRRGVPRTSHEAVGRLPSRPCPPREIARRAAMATRIPASIASTLKTCEERGVLLTRADVADARSLSRLAVAGLLVFPHPGLYARSDLWRELTPDARNLCVAKTLAALHPAWVFSHQTAALFTVCQSPIPALARSTTQLRAGRADRIRATRVTTRRRPPSGG